MRKCVLLALLLLSAAQLHAQEEPPTPLRSTAWESAGLGALGSAGGMFAGALIGVSLADCRNSFDDWCGFPLAVLGAALGSVSGAAVGAWTGARTHDGRAPAGAAVVGSLLGFGAGWAAGALVDRLGGGGGTALIAFTIGHGGVAGLYTSQLRRPVIRPEPVPR